MPHESRGSQILSAKLVEDSFEFASSPFEDGLLLEVVQVAFVATFPAAFLSRVVERGQAHDAFDRPSGRHPLHASLVSISILDSNAGSEYKSWLSR